MDAGPGDKVSIPIRRDNRSKFEEKEFVVSGVLGSRQNGTVQKVFQGYVSQEFYESLYPEEMRFYAVTLRLNESLEKDSVDMEDNGYQLGRQMELKDLTGGKAVCRGELMGSFGSAPASWVITEDTFRKLKMTEDVTEILWVDCSQKDKESVESAIQELVAGIEHIELDSYDSSLKSTRTASQAMRSAIYALLGLLGIIGFFNMANTIITGAITRKQELGVLQAVGVTNRQLNWMMQAEGVLFSVGTAAISLAIGSPLGYAKEYHFFGINEYHFPAVEIGVMVLIILLLQASLSFLLSRNLRKESLVERISYHG